jgi:hypothetical protein
VGIFVDDTGTDAREFLRTHRMSFPNGYDWKLVLAKPLGYRAMPYTVVISQKGEIVRRFFGPVTKADLVTTLDGLLTRG